MTPAQSGPVRTLHTVNRLHTHDGGTVHATMTTCKYLNQAGHPAEVAATYAPGDDVDYLARIYPEVATHRFQRSFPQRYSNSAAFCKWLSDAVRGYDLVDVHTIWNFPSFHAARVCRRVGTPYVIRAHGSLDPFDLRKHAWLKKLIGPILIRPMLAGASAILCTAPREANELVSFGAKVRRLVVPGAVALVEKAGDGRGFRRRHSIPGDALVVLFMSRLDHRKGLDFLIRALGKLMLEFPKLWFVMAGSGKSDFKARVDRWLVESGVRCITSEVGFVMGQEKLDVLAASDLFVLPSEHENFSTVVVEAMFAGLSLVLSDQVYIHEEIDAAGAGLICRPEIASVTEAVGRLLRSDAERRVMGARGRLLVEKRFRPDAATELLVRSYREVLHGPPAGI